MATYDLSRSALNSLLAADHIDPSVRQSIINYLQHDGLLVGPGSTVKVQESGYPPTLDPNAQVLLVDIPLILYPHLRAVLIAVSTASAPVFMGKAMS